MRAVVVAGQGGPEVLEPRQIDPPEPGPGDVLVRSAGAGVNFVDVYQRSGVYPRQTPFVPGMEGAGTVVSVGDEVDDLVEGDRVAWATGDGSYAELVSVPRPKAVRVPDRVSLDVAAAVMLQGITAHYLTTSTFPLAAGDRCLIHAGAGGVGLLLIQLAKRLGAEVFTTVGSEEKAELAGDAGADHVILYRDVDFGEAVESIAGPKALDVVYDGVGRSVFERSLDLLRPRGMMVTFGNASGTVDPVTPLRLMQGGSLFLTRPTIGSYVATRTELTGRTDELFDLIEKGELRVRIGARYPLEDAAAAHRALESRATTGKVLLDV